ncbi:hypothetical protein PFISCL1PPCAC_16070, partial [Pristionchus fissidentatus]
RSLATLLLLLSVSLTPVDMAPEQPYTEDDERAMEPVNPHDVIIFDVAYTIKTSYCYEGRTQSGFSVYAGALDLHGQLLWLGKLTRDNCKVHQTHEHRFEGKASFTSPKNEVLECIQGGNSDACDPRGEVVFIDMRGEFVDDWSIEMVTVNSIFEYDLVEYNTSFEHAILDPCKCRLDEPVVYQIGPASGQFLKRDSLPNVRDWISDFF